MKVLFNGENQIVSNIVAICCEQAGCNLVEQNEQDFSLFIIDYDDDFDKIYDTQNTDPDNFTTQSDQILDETIQSCKNLEDEANYQHEQKINFDLEKTLFLLPKNKFASFNVKYKIAKPFLPMELIKFLCDYNSHQNLVAQNLENISNLSSILDDIDKLDDDYFQNTKQISQENSDTNEIEELIEQGYSLEEIANILENQTEQNEYVLKFDDLSNSANLNIQNQLDERFALDLEDKNKQSSDEISAKQLCDFKKYLVQIGQNVIKDEIAKSNFAKILSNTQIYIELI